jgi:hypothetical protein
MPMNNEPERTDPHTWIQDNPDSPLDKPVPPNAPTAADLQEYQGGSGGKTGIEDMRYPPPTPVRVTPEAEPALPAAPPVERP